MQDEKDYLRYLMTKVDECHQNNDFQEEKIYQDCLNKFRLMLNHKKLAKLYKKKLQKLNESR